MAAEALGLADAGVLAAADGLAPPAAPTLAVLELSWNVPIATGTPTGGAGIIPVLAWLGPEASALVEADAPADVPGEAVAPVDVLGEAAALELGVAEQLVVALGAKAVLADGAVVVEVPPVDALVLGETLLAPVELEALVEAPALVLGLVDVLAAGEVEFVEAEDDGDALVAPIAAPLHAASRRDATAMGIINGLGRFTTITSMVGM